MYSLVEWGILLVVGFKFLEAAVFDPMKGEPFRDLIRKQIVYFVLLVLFVVTFGIS